MTQRGLSASHHAVDVREPEKVGALFDRIWSETGRVDLLVNSAGGQFPQAAIDFSVKGWNAVINTNLNGTWHMMQAAARHWRDAERPGSVVNIVVVTTHGLYGVAHTIAARSGVIGLSRALAVEWAPLGHPRQLHRAGRDRDRRLEGLFAGGARGLSPLQPDDARRLRVGHRRGLRLSRRAGRGFRDRRSVDGRRRRAALGRDLDDPQARLFPELTR